MILRHTNLERELEWTDTRHLCELVVESPGFLRGIIKDLTINEAKKELSITMDGKPLSFDRDIDVVFNPLNLDFNSKRAMTTLLKLLAKASVSEDFYLTTNDIKTKIIKYLSSMVDSGGFGFEVSVDDFAIDSIAKAVNIHIVNDEDDFVELMTDYISMMTELAGIKLFIFINLRSLLSDDDMERLHRNVDNHQINVLLLEGIARGKLESTPRWLIDRDCCEI